MFAHAIHGHEMKDWDEVEHTDSIHAHTPYMHAPMTSIHTLHMYIHTLHIKILMENMNAHQMMDEDEAERIMGAPAPAAAAPSNELTKEEEMLLEGATAAADTMAE